MDKTKLLESVRQGIEATRKGETSQIAKIAKDPNFFIPINEIKPYGKNAKKHPEKQIKQIAASIKEFGFKQPLVIAKDNEVIVGLCLSALVVQQSSWKAISGQTARNERGSCCGCRRFNRRSD